MQNMKNDDDKKTLMNLKKIIQTSENSLFRPRPRYQDAFFSPDIKNQYKMADYIKKAQGTIHLAVFSFTNDVLSNEIIAANKRGVNVKIITDDECMKGKGADAQKCANAGIPVRTDDSVKNHMHHKFMVVDKTFLVTGSFNWTF